MSHMSLAPPPFAALDGRLPQAGNRAQRLRYGRPAFPAVDGYLARLTRRRRRRFAGMASASVAIMIFAFRAWLWPA